MHKSYKERLAIAVYGRLWETCGNVPDDPLAKDAAGLIERQSREIAALRRERDVLRQLLLEAIEEGTSQGAGVYRNAIAGFAQDVLYQMDKAREG